MSTDLVSCSFYGVVGEHDELASVKLPVDPWRGQTRGVNPTVAEPVSEPGPRDCGVLTTDPLASVTGAPYTYAGDDPVNMTDPSGLLGVSLTSPAPTPPQLVCSPVSASGQAAENSESGVPAPWVGPVAGLTSGTLVLAGGTALAVSAYIEGVQATSIIVAFAMFGAASGGLVVAGAGLFIILWGLYEATHQ